MLDVGCLESCTLGEEGVNKLQYFHEDLPKYMYRAASGENRYNLQIDKDWAQFIYDSTKMTFAKIFAIIIAIAPSLIKFPSFFMQKLLVNGCNTVILNPYTVTPVPLGECVKYNGNSLFVNKKYFSFSPADLSSALLFFVILSLPQLIFMVVIWIRFKNNKYTVWLSSAKINLTSFDKKLLTGKYLVGCLFLGACSFKVTSWILELNQRFFRSGSYPVPYISGQDLHLTFDQSDVNSFGNTLSTLLIYSCLLTVLMSHIREPMAFFTGFRNYLKKASVVPYNTAIVDFRIQKEEITWKFVKMYYEQCERYDPNIVLIALTTHFIDLGILLYDNSNPYKLVSEETEAETETNENN